MALSDEFVSELKSRNPIADVIGSYVPIKKMGRNLKCKCPFHNETDASFVIYNDTQSFYCFGCQAAGDVITFVRNIEHLDYLSAIQLLADRANMVVPEQNSKAAKLDMDRKKVIEINKVTARFFFKQLFSDQGKSALEYLKNRKIHPNTVKKFGLGYSPNTWDSLTKYLIEKNYTKEELVMAAVCVKGKNSSIFDQFRGRLMFPIINIRGEVVGFGARALSDDGPKYLNSSDTPAFKKSRNLFSMNFAKAAKTKEFILAEGYMDVIALHQAGFNNAVATLGTALTNEQAYLISNYGDQVVISYDSDESGKKAAKRAVLLFDKTPVRVRVLQMEGAKDPDEYLKKYPPEKFQLLLDNSRASTDYLIDSIRNKYNISIAEEQVLYLREVIKCLGELSDKGEQDIYAGKIAEELSVSKDTILHQLGLPYKDGHAHIIQNKMNPDKKNKDTGKTVNNKISKAEQTIILMLYKNVEYLSLVHNNISSEDFVSDTNKKIFSVLVDKIENGTYADISSYNDFLEDVEISKFVYIINNVKVMTMTKDILLEHIGVLKQEKNKKSAAQIRVMEKDELSKYIQSLSSKKRGEVIK